MRPVTDKASRAFFQFLRKRDTSGIPSKRRTALVAALQAERLATTAGMQEFLRKKTDFVGTSPLLRRNIHRLEKGLCMPALIAFIGDLSVYAEPCDRHLIFIDTGLAAI